MPCGSFRYFESSDVIVVKKKYRINFRLLITSKIFLSEENFDFEQLDLKVYKLSLFLYLLTHVKKAGTVIWGVPGCRNRTDDNSNITILVTMIMLL